LTLSRRLLLPGLVLGALLRAIVLPLPGTGDLDVWKIWSFGAAHDLTGVYGVGGTPPERRLLHWHGAENTVDYPPVALGELAIAGRAYEARHPLFEDSRTLNAMVKLPGVVFEMALVGLILTWGHKWFGADVAARTALAVWINPALLLAGPILGYLDAQMAVPAFISLVAAWSGAGWLAGALAATAVLTKPQALFVFPVVGMVLLTRAPLPKRAAFEAAAAAALVAGLVLVPFVWRGAWANLLQALGRLGTHDMLSANASNFWWIVTWVLRVLDVAGEWGWSGALTQEVRILGISRAIALGYPNARVVGAMAVLGAFGWAVWRTRRPTSLATAAAWAGWCAYAYALLAAQVHENHLFLAVIFLAVASGLERRYVPVSGWLTGVLTLNLLLFYGLGRGMPGIIERRWTGVDASVLLAFVNLGVFAWATRLLMRQTPSPSARQSA
jgi:hypothetical protein